MGVDYVCNLYSITTNQAAIIALFRVMNHYVGNLPPMTGVFPDYPAPVARNANAEREIIMMRWGMPPPPRAGGFPVTNIRNTNLAALARLAETGKPLPGPGQTASLNMRRSPIPLRARRTCGSLRFLNTKHSHLFR
jgi:hypothetical protein